MKPTQTLKLHPLYFPTYHRCCNCQRFGVASAVVILSKSLIDRRRYFCPACATAKGCPPAKELLSRLPEALEARAKAKPTPGQKQRKTKAVAGKCK
jgi:hypothetical protein